MEFMDPFKSLSIERIILGTMFAKFHSIMCNLFKANMYKIYINSNEVTKRKTISEFIALYVSLNKHFTRISLTSKMYM